MDLAAQESVFDVMIGHLAESTVEMFEPYALTVSLANEEKTNRLELNDHSVVASIGYAGDKIRGALLLVTSRTAVESWITALGQPLEEADVCDTIGEFSNMLLGRLKARLLGEGLRILLSTPTAAIGTDLHVVQPAGCYALLSFAGPGWSLQVRIGNTFEEGFVLVEPGPGESAAEAGDMMFF